MPKEVGLAEARAVAEGGPMPGISEGDAKLLGFFLRHGECTAEISESTISVWYFGPRLISSRYLVSLAPGLVCQLMQLGEVQRIADEATFQVGPGTAGTGPYVFDFKRKWVRIRCEDERIIIKIRDKRKNLKDRDPGRCERCNSELRTPLAKQCFHCGFDWH